jgi:hypothetical protein
MYNKVFYYKIKLRIHFNINLKFYKGETITIKD